MAFAKFTRVERVIEFGGGSSSTFLFLDKHFFPDLISLVTFEHDASWGDRIRTGDERHNLIVIPSGEFMAASTGMSADFVFIDCVGDRGILMPHALTLAPVFAIHDTREHDVKGFRYVRGFNGHIQTVFASDTMDLSGLEIEHNETGG